MSGASFGCILTYVTFPVMFVLIIMGLLIFDFYYYYRFLTTTFFCFCLHILITKLKSNWKVSCIYMDYKIDFYKLFKHRYLRWAKIGLPTLELFMFLARRKTIWLRRMKWQITNHVILLGCIMVARVDINITWHISVHVKLKHLQKITCFTF